jgi:hypothetical protein
MVNLAVPDFHPVKKPEGTIGQFYVQGTVFFVTPQVRDDCNLFPRIDVNVWLDDNGEQSRTYYTLFPETPNGVSPIDHGASAPPIFWEAFNAIMSAHFQEQQPNCQVTMDGLYRLDNGEIVIDQPVVFAESQP